MYQNVDDSSILIMGYYHFHILGFYIQGFHLRFSQISKKVKSGKLLANFLAAQSELNAGIIRVSEIYQKSDNSSESSMKMGHFGPKLTQN